MQVITTETYELGKILASVTESLLRAEVLTNSKNIRGAAKHWVKTTIINRLAAIRKDILSDMPPDDAQIMKDDILNDETALQISNITNMVLALPKGIRDDIEAYIESRHNIYSLNEKRA